MTLHKLDEIALNIELVLISIIEGVALTKLAENAAPIVHFPIRILFVPYILAALAILLVFWAQAILHAITFIRWPLRMTHMFLYFIAALLQIIAYTAMTEIVTWFLWWSIFSVVTLIIYYVDLGMIDDIKERYSKLPSGNELVESVRTRHLKEMKYLVPIAVVTNLLSCALAFKYPSAGMVLGLGLLQLGVSFYAVLDTIETFKKRSVLIGAMFENKV